MSKSTKTGQDLELEVMRQCAVRLKKLPQAARCRVADWLQQSALDEQAEIELTTAQAAE